MSGDIRLSMSDEEASGWVLQTRYPSEKFVPIGMGRKAMYLNYPCPDRTHLPQYPYLLRSANDLSSQRPHRLISYEEYSALLFGDLIDQMMLNPSTGTHTRTGYDDHRLLDMIYTLGLIGGSGYLQSREVEW